MKAGKRTYKIGGIQYNFNFKYFNTIFDREYKDKEIRVRELEEKLGEYTCVDWSTVHSWRNEASAPSDIEKVKSIAEYFNVDEKNLFIKVNDGLDKIEEESKIVKLDNAEKHALKRVYQAMLKLARAVETFYAQILDKDDEYYQNKENGEERLTRVSIRENLIARLLFNVKAVLEEVRIDLPPNLYKALDYIQSEMGNDLYSLDLPGTIAIFSLDYYSPNTKKLYEYDARNLMHEQKWEIIDKKIEKLPDELREKMICFRKESFVESNEQIKFQKCIMHLENILVDYGDDKFWKDYHTWLYEQGIAFADILQERVEVLKETFQ